MPFPFFGEICGLIAAVLWSSTVILLRVSSNQITPFLINPIKNSIGLILFLILFSYFEIPFWYQLNDFSDYLKIIISGSLGMALGDTIFIYALSKIGLTELQLIHSRLYNIFYLF